MSLTRINRTGEPKVIQASDWRLTISVPIQIKRRSGRKFLTLPGGESAGRRLWDGDPTPLQLALARGHRWLSMLESGAVTSLREIARMEGVDSSYVCPPEPRIRRFGLLRILRRVPDALFGFGKR